MTNPSSPLYPERPHFAPSRPRTEVCIPVLHLTSILPRLNEEGGQERRDQGAKCDELSNNSLIDIISGCGLPHFTTRGDECSNLRSFLHRRIETLSTVRLTDNPDQGKRRVVLN